MARESATRKRSTESRLIFTVLGVAVWIVTGFLVGLVAGVVSEEPELLVSHMAGRDTEIEWAAAGTGDGGERSAQSIAAKTAPLAPVGAPPRSVLEDRPPSVPVFSEGEAEEAGENAAPQAGSPKPEAEAPKPSPGAAPSFLIQVGAYDNRDSAREVAETLRGKGYAVEVLSTADDGRFRVRVGPVVARDRAEGLARRLQDDEGLPTWILRAREG